MNATIIALLGYIRLDFAIVWWLWPSNRTGLVMKQKKRRQMDLKADGFDSPPLGQRITSNRPIVWKVLPSLVVLLLWL